MGGSFQAVRMRGNVVRGFGRGSKQLGIPTANLPDEETARIAQDLDTGIYFGWCSVLGGVYKMVMSLGWNPFYKNEKKTSEIHVMHKFEHDFYGEELRVVVLGFIRPERNFGSLDELITAINSDIEFANTELDKPGLASLRDDPFLTKS